jgi:hypothetical protein
MEQRRVRSQQGRHAGHRQPHQHLVCGDHAQPGDHAGAHAALAGGGDQGQIAWPGNEEKKRMAATKAP